MRLVGYTIGNDMSSRDIEGANPLYLPQAKVYDACCALGPVITLAEAMPPIDSVQIALAVCRDGAVVFQGAIGADQIHRPFANLIDHLGRDNPFPHGAFLLTGTGIVPDNEFTLLPADEVAITIDGIGTLVNTVVQG
jgi:2-dehydro-3-deoxy-D-arabinonate dehydratase